MTYLIRSATLAGAMLIFAQAANAECRLDVFDVASGQISARYDPFEALEPPISVAISSSGTGDCADQRIRLSVEPDPSMPFSVGNSIGLQFGSGTLEARLTDGNGRRIPDGRSAGGDAFLRLGSSGAARDGDLRLQIPAGQRVSPGVYTARLVLVVEPVGQDGRRSQPIRSPFNISVTVLPVVGLAAGSDTRIDLGTIQSGSTAQRPVSFRAYANTGYSLQFVSDNEFNLTLDGRRDGARIAYVPVLGGQEFNPGARGPSFADPGMQGYREHRLNVRVPQLGQRPAGVYRDYITVEITATVGGERL